MLDDQDQLKTWILALSSFGLIFCLWLVGLLVLSMRKAARAQRIEKRLRSHSPVEAEEKVLSLWLEDRTATLTVQRVRRHISLVQRFEQMLSDAGWSVTPATVLLALAGVTSFAVSVSYALTQSLVAGLGLSGGVALASWFYLKHCIAKRESIFENQLVDALDLAARSLRAGHPLLGAFQLIADEIPAPVGKVFLEICQEQALGLSLDEAMQNASRKHASDDLRLFVTSVIIQSRSGGNLADMMDRLASVIRERMRLGRRVRVLTAQTQFSKRVLLGLPVFVFILLNTLNPGYLGPLMDTERGRLVMAVGIGLLLLGAWTMNRLAVLRY